MSAYEGIKQGLAEALAFAEGKETCAQVHQVAVPTVDVKNVFSPEERQPLPLRGSDPVY